MGCSGSNVKSAYEPSLQRKAGNSHESDIAPVPEQAKGDTHGDFKITLEKTMQGEGLGLVISEHQLQFMIVEQLKAAGLVPTWNRKQQNAPELQIKPGDIILAINGIFGNTVDMRKAASLWAQESITLTVRRGVLEADDGIGAPAVGNPDSSDEKASAEPPSKDETPVCMF